MNNVAAPARGRQCRSFVLIAVLIVIGGATLVASGLLFIAQGRVADTSSLADAAQSRALAWSGVQAVMSELQQQRERLLAGESPTLSQQITIYDTPTRIGIVRLLPMSSDGFTLFSAESGKLDLNSTNVEALSKTGLIDEAAAERIMAHRAGLGRPLQSVLELLNVADAGVSPTLVLGPIEDLKLRDQAQHTQGDLAERVLARLQQSRVRGLADAMTVFSVEPNVQRNGSPRINLNAPWSDLLATQLSERLGQAAVEHIKPAIERGVKFDTDAKIVALMRSISLPLESWSDWLDALTTESTAYRHGRVDISRAPAEVLQTLPGITSETASRMLAERATLTSDEMQTPVWLMRSNILSQQEFEQITHHITTRCLVFGVRLAAGEVAADQPEGPMSNPFILEAVIDLASAKPRVAYLRDVSVLQAAAQIAVEMSDTSPHAMADATEEADRASEVRESPVASAATEPSSDDPPAADINETIVPIEGSETSGTSNRRIGRWRVGG